MSDKLGPMHFGRREEMVFLGRDFNEQKDYSEQTAIDIDAEVKRIVNAGYELASSILSEQRAVLERIANELLEKESLDGATVYAIIEEMTGLSLPRPKEPMRPRAGGPPGGTVEAPPEPEGERVPPLGGLKPGVATA